MVSRVPHKYKVGSPCHVLIHGPRRDKDWMCLPAIVTKVTVCPRGPVWHRHIEQLSPRYGIEEDWDPGQVLEPTMPQDGLGSSET